MDMKPFCLEPSAVSTHRSANRYCSCEGGYAGSEGIGGYAGSEGIERLERIGVDAYGPGITVRGGAGAACDGQAALCENQG